MLRATSVREWINFVQHNLPSGSMCPIDGIIIFHPINANRVLQPHEDALILTLGISGFDRRRVLIDRGSSVDLLQMSVYKQMGFLPFALGKPRAVTIWVQWSHNNFSIGCCITRPGWPDHPKCAMITTQKVLFYSL